MTIKEFIYDRLNVWGVKWNYWDRIIAHMQEMPGSLTSEELDKDAGDYPKSFHAVIILALAASVEAWAVSIGLNPYREVK